MTYQTNLRCSTEGSGSATETLSYSQGFNAAITNTIEESKSSSTKEKKEMKIFKGVGKGSLNKLLLDRALSIIDSTNLHDVQNTALDIESFHGIVLELWESALNCSQEHQDILALLDNALICIINPNDEQIGIIRESIVDLMNTNLSCAHVEVIQRRFIRADISPLSLLSEVEEEE